MVHCGLMFSCLECFDGYTQFENMNYDWANVEGYDSSYTDFDAGMGIDNSADCAAKCDELGDDCFGYVMDARMPPPMPTYCIIYTGKNPSTIDMVATDGMDIYMRCGSDGDSNNSEGTYVMGPTTTDGALPVCPVGSVPITSEEDCQAAGLALDGHDFQHSDSWAGNPPGCFKNRPASETRLYYNTHSSGGTAGHPGYALVCKESSQAPTMHPTFDPTQDPTLQGSDNCESWCVNHEKGWKTVCTFAKCSGCDECTSVDTSCPDWCGTSTAAPWVQKCKNWTACTTCSTCSGLEGKECKPWCSGNGQDWSRKCTWVDCNGCDDCLEQ